MAQSSIEVILLKPLANNKFRNKTKLGDVVRVKPGYVRNYLIPQGIAVLATRENRAAWEAHKSTLEAQEKEKRLEAEIYAERLKNVVVEVFVKTSEAGKLFGSVSVRDMVAALHKMNIELSKHQIFLNSGPIRHIGQYEIPVVLHHDVSTTIQLIVRSET